MLVHPFVVGELACGNICNRAGLLALLRNLAPAPAATDTEVLGFMDRHELMGRGIGYLDVHLLASAALAGSGRLWTRDKRLASIAGHLILSFHPQAH